MTRPERGSEKKLTDAGTPPWGVANTEAAGVAGTDEGVADTEAAGVAGTDEGLLQCPPHAVAVR